MPFKRETMTTDKAGDGVAVLSNPVSRMVRFVVTDKDGTVTAFAQMPIGNALLIAGRVIEFAAVMNGGGPGAEEISEEVGEVNNGYTN